MALGRRKELQQGELFFAADNPPTSDGHLFYTKFNSLLAEAGLDAWIECVCQPHYKDNGRPSIPPEVYYRMLLIGYDEGIQSQRGIARRCADCFLLRNFWKDRLGLILRLLKLSVVEPKQLRTSGKDLSSANTTEKIGKNLRDLSV